MEWPPKTKLLPEGIAGLFLMTHCTGTDKASVEDLVEIFKLYWEEGERTGKIKLNEEREGDLK